MTRKVLASGYAYGTLRSTSYSLGRARERAERKEEMAWLGELARQAREIKARAVARAIEADWLSDQEIAQELGCDVYFVQCVRMSIGAKRSPRW